MLKTQPFSRSLLVFATIALALVLVLASVAPARAQEPSAPVPVHLYDDATGGDCTSVGAWDWPTKTCTLTQDVNASIQILDGGLTLDGDGHQVDSQVDSAAHDYAYAVFVDGANNVTVKNLHLNGGYGILLAETNNSTVIHNTIAVWVEGLRLRGADYNTIGDNTISPGPAGLLLNGMNLTDSDHNLVNGNTISDNVGVTIYLYGAKDNTITGNTLASSAPYADGIFIYGQIYDEWGADGSHYYYDGTSVNNTVYRNNFLDIVPFRVHNLAQNTGNVFNLAAPNGGNYYLRFDQPEEGCSDTNSDGFCDAPFSFDGGVDYLPLTSQISSNQPPALAAGAGSVTVDEGQTATMTGTVSDADGDAVTLTASAGIVTNHDDGTWSWSFATADGPDDSQAVTLYADDAHGGTAQVSFELVVHNVPPAIDGFAAPVDPLNISAQPVIAQVQFSDPGADAHDVAFDWGDGNSVTLTGVASPSSASHTYAEPGVYEIRVRVEEQDDPGASDQFTYQYVVIYDPNGQSVTGGGWIDSPRGAYRPNADLTGKANFGFVAKYKKGAQVPDGVTEFQFQVADLNFHSTGLEYLVVSQGGTNAQFKGAGTINGGGSYKFMIWATDGSPDTFRIKIWQGENDVIYDNGVAQALGGGSIVVHK